MQILFPFPFSLFLFLFFCWYLTREQNKNDFTVLMCLVSLKNSLLFALLLYHCSHLTDTIITITITACSLFAILLTTAIVFLEFHTQLVNRLLEFQLYATLLTTFLQAKLVRYSFPFTTNRYSAYKIFVSANLFSLDLNSGDLPTGNLFRCLIHLLVCFCVVYLSHTHTDVTYK